MTSYLRAEPAIEGAVPFRRPLDILIMTSDAPPIVSEISTCIDRLATGLIARQHRVTVLSSPHIRRVAFGEWRLSSFVAHWPRIVRELRHFDVVNVHGPVPAMSDAFLWLSSRLPPYNRPAIVYTHHSPIDIPGTTRISSVYNKLHLALAQRADRIVASSPHHARQHRSRYGPVVRAIPWGADLQVSLPVRLRPAHGELNVLFAGQMRPDKGVETLLAAAAGQSCLKLTLAGAGPELVRYRRLAERLGVVNVRFTGPLSDAELRHEYVIADVVVLPSVTPAEASGPVLIEGMAAGCVPVASDLPGVRDIAGPTGLVVPAGNPDALRAALCGLARDTGQLERLQAASRLAAEPLTWDRCVTSYEGILLEAARSRYARLHGLTILPQLEDSGPQLHDSGPQLHDSGPQLHDSGPQLHDSGLDVSELDVSELDVSELDDSGPRRANSVPGAGLWNGSRMGPHPVPVPEVSASNAEFGR
jgi:glycosyltransferase involved in cell wall biosynthesis